MRSALITVLMAFATMSAFPDIDLVLDPGAVIGPVKPMNAVGKDGKVALVFSLEPNSFIYLAE